MDDNKFRLQPCTTTIPEDPLLGLLLETTSCSGSLFSNYRVDVNCFTLRPSP